MNVRLRPLTEEDAHTSYRWRNDRELWTLTRFHPDREITIENELEWIRKALNDPSSRRYGIIADGQYVGNIYLTGIGEGSAEYHVFIGERSMWGKGVARKASERVFEIARDELGLKRIHLIVRPENVRAIRIYEGFGFERTGMENGFIRMELEL